jgi:hypothetical protein
LDAALYPLGEEIKSGRVHRLIDFVRRAYRYRRQKFVLTLDRPACDALARGSINESHHLVHSLRRNRKRSSLDFRTTRRWMNGFSFCKAI